MLVTVPAWVCDQCGGAYFEEREVAAIQSAIKGLDQQAQQLVADLRRLNMENGRRSITAETAVRLGRYFGNHRG